MSPILESSQGVLHPKESGDPVVQPLPIGFGRGRRSNQIVILHSPTPTGEAIPELIPPWVPGTAYNDFWLALLSGFAVSAGETGFDFVWRGWRQGESSAEVAQDLPAYDGIIFVSPRDQQRPLVDMLADLQIPTVLAWARHSDPRYPFVTCNNSDGVAQAVRHLVRLGHTRIGYLGGSPTIVASHERCQAYHAAISSAGLAIEPQWVVGCEPPEIGAIAADLLGRPDRPSAWVCFDDSTAVSVIEQAWELGLRVPDDVAVVGFDDVEEALQVIPHLTTVRQPVSDVAGLSVHLVARCIEGQQPPTGSWQAELPVTLVVRESCGAAPAIDIPAGADATGPQTLRQELEWRMRQLAAMNQEMKELLHAASHDLRSPLITIQGFASTLERRYSDLLGDRGRSYLHRIGRSVESMQGLIDSLLTLSRVHSRPLNPQHIPVRAIIERVVADLESVIAEKHARISIKRRLPTVLADETALYQVFLNLISNALKYLGYQPTPLISINHRAWPEEHEFSVQDNGIGIAPEYHEEIFQPFRRLHTVEAEGVGIGLAIVKRIILRHGGRIWVDSQRGEGSAFRFTLPRRETNYDD
ncbi:MAG: substrate-binding domain-containing protein [Armatimonadota bacterium]